MDSFELKIEMGNSAMLTTKDVAEVLRKIVSKKLDIGQTKGVIKDRNGNRVGSWKFNEDV